MFDACVKQDRPAARELFYFSLFVDKVRERVQQSGSEQRFIFVVSVVVLIKVRRLSQSCYSIVIRVFLVIVQNKVGRMIFFVSHVMKYYTASLSKRRIMIIRRGLCRAEQLSLRIINDLLRFALVIAILWL